MICPLKHVFVYHAKILEGKGKGLFKRKRYLDLFLTIHVLHDDVKKARRLSEVRFYRYIDNKQWMKDQIVTTEAQENGSFIFGTLISTNGEIHTKPTHSRRSRTAYDELHITQRPTKLN